MTEPARRAFLLYYASVLLREARARRNSRGPFHAILLNGAAKARREAARIDLTPRQGTLL